MQRKLTTRVWWNSATRGAEGELAGVLLEVLEGVTPQFVRPVQSKLDQDSRVVGLSPLTLRGARG